MTADLEALRWLSMVMRPVTAGKFRVAAKASRILAGSMDLARRMASPNTDGNRNPAPPRRRAVCPNGLVASIEILHLGAGIVGEIVSAEEDGANTSGA